MTGDDYSMIADILYKFNTSSDWIKALWLICFTAILLGSLWFVHDIIKIITKAKQAKQGDFPREEIAD